MQNTHMVKYNSDLQTKTPPGTSWTKSHKPESGVDSGKTGLQNSRKLEGDIAQLPIWELSLSSPSRACGLVDLDSSLRTRQLHAYKHFIK